MSKSSEAAKRKLRREMITKGFTFQIIVLVCGHYFSGILPLFNFLSLVWHASRIRDAYFGLCDLIFLILGLTLIALLKKA